MLSPRSRAGVSEGLINDPRGKHSTPECFNRPPHLYYCFSGLAKVTHSGHGALSQNVPHP
ncbi:hypothetical protein I79_002665 [Cricetulus griseus]|uniref:Uncharacterized protein n=1 Tax=Cricetulus griseus TaxID=10029 RepID=G3GY14_CRIGR|nr:hypothetical protein I79_002665 [Cricetulus griseus]